MAGGEEEKGRGRGRRAMSCVRSFVSLRSFVRSCAFLGRWEGRAIKIHFVFILFFINLLFSTPPRLTKLTDLGGAKIYHTQNFPPTERVENLRGFWSPFF